MTPIPRPKKRPSPPWAKSALHFSLCFVLGLFTGFSHPSTPSLHLTLTSPDPIPPPPPPPPPPLPPTPPPPTSTPLLIFITTTRSTNPLQPTLLQRLSRTLRLVPPPLLWIIVEAHDEAPATADVLRRTGILYRHLTYREQFGDTEEEEHHQRNVALSHVEHHRLEGIVCFVDAENVYDFEFFDKIRGVDVFGVWPVAIMTAGGDPEIMVEGPVCNSSKVVGWYSSTGETTARPEVSIWGFGFNSSILWDPERWGRPTSFPDTSQDSMKYIHEAILEDKSKVKAFPSGCTVIMLWRLQIQAENIIQSRR